MGGRWRDGYSESVLCLRRCRELCLANRALGHGAAASSELSDFAKACSWWCWPLQSLQRLSTLVFEAISRQHGTASGSDHHRLRRLICPEVVHEQIHRFSALIEQSNCAACQGVSV